MSLEFEKLAQAVSDMVQQTSQRRKQQQEQLAEALARLRNHALAWDLFKGVVAEALEKGDSNRYQAALPLHHQPLNAGIPAPAVPEKATIVACDGSQIVPDRHAPFLYYLINTGVIAYYHGSGRPPSVFSSPVLAYPRDEDRDETDRFTLNSALVGLYRDRLEIDSLAKTIVQTDPWAGPKLAILDQRLLYWPASGIPERVSKEVQASWQQSMTAIRENGAWLAGFIDRPGKRSVLSLLQTLDIAQPTVNIDDLYDLPSFHFLTDIDLYAPMLQQGERSPVFVEISRLNTQFCSSDPHNEVCFFYLRTGHGDRQLARVDIPMWVAKDEDNVAAVHALINDQCQILGNYPYVITRADEIAVIGRREQEELEHMIALRLAEQGIETHITSKQQSKDYARSGKTRHERI